MLLLLEDYHSFICMYVSCSSKLSRAKMMLISYNHREYLSMTGMLGGYRTYFSQLNFSKFNTNYARALYYNTDKISIFDRGYSQSFTTRWAGSTSLRVKSNIYLSLGYWFISLPYPYTLTLSLQTLVHYVYLLYQLTLSSCSCEIQPKIFGDRRS